MNGAQIHTRSLLSLLVAVVCSACPEPRGPSLDEALDEFARLRNEEKAVSCACYETVGPGQGMYATEQECLDAAGRVDSEELACMKALLEDSTQDVAKSVELIECYNDAMRTNVACKEANLGLCSVVVSNDCVDSRSYDINACRGSFSYDTVESLWNCSQPL